MKSSLSPHQKRKYLHILFSEGEEVARNYLENVVCVGGFFLYKSEKELEAFKQQLEECCPEGYSGTWFFIPNGNDRMQKPDS